MLVISRETFPSFISITAKLIILGCNIVVYFTIKVRKRIVADEVLATVKFYSENLLNPEV